MTGHEGIRAIALASGGLDSVVSLAQAREEMEIRLVVFMNYGQRDDFNHWLLTGASVFAILTSTTGLAIWWGRRRWPLRRRSQPTDVAM